MLEDILLLEHVGPIVLCLLAGPFSDRWHCFILNNHETHRYGRKLPLLLSCLGMSLTYAGYGILVTIDPKHKWVSQPVLLLSPAYHPTIICCLPWESPWEASSLSSSRFFLLLPNLIWSKYLRVSQQIKLFPSMPDVLCLHQRLLRQPARRQSKVYKVKFYQIPLPVLDLSWRRVLYILVPLLAVMQVVFAILSLDTR